MANFENKRNVSVPTELRSKKSRVESTPQSTLQRNYNKYKPEQYDSDVDDSDVNDDSQLEDELEEVAIDEKFKLIDLEDGSYYIPFRAAQRSNHEMRKKRRTSSFDEC